MARANAAAWIVVALALALPADAQRLAAGDELAAVAALQRTVVDVIARTEPSVVAISRSSGTRPRQVFLGMSDLFGDIRPITSEPAEPTITGAGVIIDPSGLILTQYLAVGEGDQHTVTTLSGNSYPASIKAADPRSGLAVLAIDRQAAAGSSLPPVRFGDAAQLRKGQFVVVLGNPYAIRSDGQPTASWGIVSNIARKAAPGVNLNNTPGPLGDYRTTLHHLGTLIQTDARLGWSAGGGALVNLQGEMVGLTTTAATIAGHEQPAGYAIPINAALGRVIDVLKQGREVEYGLLGVSFDFRREAVEAATGVTVQQVHPGSPAAQAGLEPGDVITDVDGRRVADVDAVQLVVGTRPPATATTIRYVRRGRPATAKVTLAKLAVPGKKIVTSRPPGWRGIHVDYATALDAAALVRETASGALDPQGCVLVTEVEAGSPAWQAGVRPGMFISHVGSQRVTTPDEFRAAVQGVGDTLNIRFTQPLGAPAEPAGPSRPIPPSQ